MSRKVHLVGSLPGESTRGAMETALARLGPYLLTLPDGETGERAAWLGASVRNFGRIPGLAAVRQPSPGEYNEAALFRLLPDAILDPGDLDACLVYEAAFRASFPVFQELRRKYARPDLPFQVGIPSQLDLCAFSFGFASITDSRYCDASLAATAGQIQRIHSAGGSEVIFQLETPAALVQVARQADPVAAVRAARSLAGQLAELPATAPPGTRFGVHLCLGDLDHRSLARMEDISPAVLMANELSAAWPSGRPLEYLHMPFAAAAEPPACERSFYAPLKRLGLPAVTRFVAGCIHESLPAGRQLELLRLIEGAAGRTADVAAACGLGRRPDASQAADAMTKALLLVESPA